MMIFSHLNFIFSISKLLLFGDNYDDFFTPQLHIFYKQNCCSCLLAPELQVPRERSAGWVVEWRMGISRLLDRVYAYMADEALFLFFFFQKLRPSTYLGVFFETYYSPPPHNQQFYKSNICN